MQFEAEPGPEGWVYGRAPLLVDVHADAIYVQHGEQLQIVRRADDGHHSLAFGGLGMGLGVDPQLIAVPRRDDLLVWSQRLDRSDESGVYERRVLAARVDALDEPWPLFDYPGGSAAVQAPVVVGDRVALLTTEGIVHAALDGADVGVLPLALPPAQPMSNQGDHLVWIARDGDHDFVVSTDASVEAEVIEYEEHEAGTQLLAAAKFVGSLVTVSTVASPVEADDRLPMLIIERHGSTPGAVELLRRSYDGQSLRLLSDGEQAWLVLDRELWRIGPDTHAPVPAFMSSATVGPRALALDRDIVRRIVRAHINEVRSCYNQGLREQPELRGIVEIVFVIGGDGTVRKTVDTSGDRFADHQVRDCIATAIRRWKFPKPKGGEQVTVKHPFELSPA